MDGAEIHVLIIGHGYVSRSLYYWSHNKLLTLIADDSDVRKVQPDLQAKIKSLGQVTIKFLRVKDSRPVVDPKPFNFEGLDETTIPEKAMKGRAVSHCAG